MRLAVLVRAEMDGHCQLLSVMLSVAQSPGDQGLLLTHFHSHACAGKLGMEGEGRMGELTRHTRDRPVLPGGIKQTRQVRPR